MSTSSGEAKFVYSGRSNNRRSSFRVTAAAMSVRAWRMDTYDRLIDRARPSRRIAFTPLDMGRGGMAATVPSVCLFHAGDRIRLALPTAEDVDEALLTEVRVVYVNALCEEDCRIGLQFQPALSETLARRFDNALDRILASLQRAELRRNAAA